MEQPHPPALGSKLIGEGVTHPHGRLRFLPIKEIPQHIGYEQQQEQEIFFVDELHFIKLYSSSDGNQ
jgi:hypothetical protein